MTSPHSPEFYFPAPRKQRYCSQCGAPTLTRVPDGDNRMRDLCDHCGAIHYQNPRVVVGTLPVWENRILLCRRAIEPRYNTWTLPAGFMELGETLAQGAERETREEAGAQIRLGSLFSVLDVPHADQVHVFFLAEVQNPQLNPGPESLEARYFDEAEIPWDKLSFRTVIATLRYFLADRRNGAYGVHHDAITLL